MIAEEGASAWESAEILDQDRSPADSAAVWRVRVGHGPVDLSPPREMLWVVEAASCNLFHHLVMHPYHDLEKPVIVQ